MCHAPPTKNSRLSPNVKNRETGQFATFREDSKPMTSQPTKHPTRKPQHADGYSDRCLSLPKRRNMPVELSCFVAGAAVEFGTFAIIDHDFKTEL